MIKSVHITNFQSHRDSLLEFSRGVNVIVGQSDSGKTSIIRAIKWLLENRPSGEEYIKRGADKAYVALKTDGGMIERMKGKNRNSYFVDGLELKAMGQTVPVEVSSILNMSEVNITDSQFDAPFLISESAGEIARRLNEVSNISSIDDAVSEVNSRIRTVSSELVVKEADMEEIDKKLEEFPDMDGLAGKLVTLQSLDMKLKKSKADRAELKVLLNQIAEIESETAKFQRLFKRLPELYTMLKKLEKTMKEQQESVGKRTGIGNLLEEYRRLSLDMDMVCQELEEEQERYDRAKPETCPLCGGKWK